MSTNDASASTPTESQKLLEEWLARLAELIATVEPWAKEAGWATRRLDKQMDDSRLGNYMAPMLLMQVGAERALLEPIARFTPGTDGVVDLYLMPAYDDIASLYYADGNWQLHNRSGNGSAWEHAVLTKEAFQQTLEALCRHAA